MNKEERKAYQKIYRQSHKKEIKSYYQKNKKEILARQKKYYQENKKKIKVSMKIYRDSRKEKSKVYRKIHYQNNKEIISEKCKIYNQTFKGKEVKKKAGKKYRQKNPKKAKTREVLNNAIARRKITKPKTCSICNKTDCKIEGHHPSYKAGDELKVIWCCPQCHTDLHNKKNNI